MKLDSMGRQRRGGSNAGKNGLPSKDAPRTGKALPLSPPEPIGADGAAWYRKAAAMIHAMGFGDASDSGHVMLAAKTFQELRDAERHVEKYGLVIAYLDKAGKPAMKKNPAVGIAQRARETLRLFHADLGLTPASRAKFGSGAEPEEDPFEALLAN